MVANGAVGGACGIWSWMPVFLWLGTEQACLGLGEGMTWEGPGTSAGSAAEENPRMAGRVGRGVVVAATAVNVAWPCHWPKLGLPWKWQAEKLGRVTVGQEFNEVFGGKPTAI